MSNVIMIGCDLHGRNMLLRYAVGNGEAQQLSYDNDSSGRRRMVNRLKSLAQKPICKIRLLLLTPALKFTPRSEGYNCFLLSIKSTGC
ncbi:hypothetical protein FF011L_01870 [Roseimaritima multifibrata]|uniref:Uncharacterized protein n=1 Tax=Roseimaritima multifibrata TaxID=1930274 RepID=A0A517M9J6_9BACT|nr:hypothetical protein FF011L_01870 [Roseimaritima multifibrata]